MLSRSMIWRRPSLAALLVAGILMAACGGGSDSTSPPGGNPPPVIPPVDNTPASLALVAGDAQIAVPGATVAVKPVVVVKNAAGTAIAGLTVTFAVDSGNGSLQSTSVATATDGTASPGDWRLGAGEGRNVITARVGSLSALKMTATAQVATVTVAGQSVPTGGGVVTLTQAGSALNGTTLTILPGSLGAASTIGFTISSATAIVLPAGMTAISPALTITGFTTLLKQPATLRLPSVAPAGRVLLVLSQDVVTKEFSVMSSASITATGVTVALGTSEAATTSIAAGVALRAPQQPIIVPVVLDPSQLSGDFDSNFRPGTDDWEFQRQLISSFPETLSNGLVDPASSMVATSLWYFVNRKTTNGKLWEKYEEATGVPESNRRGLRWASVANGGIPDLFSPGGVASIVRTGYQANAATQSQQQMYEIKAAFLLSSNKPQPIFTFTATNATVNTDPRYGIAYRTVGNAIDLAIPDGPSKSFRISLGASGWTPASVTTANGNTYTVDFVAPIHYGILVPHVVFQQQFPLVTAGTIGDAQGWPSKPTLHSAFGVLDTSSVYLLDTLQLWWECGGCEDHGFRSQLINPPPSKQAQFRQAPQRTDLSWGPLSATRFQSASLSAASFTTTTTSRVGYALIQPGIGSTAFVANPAWLDWTTVTYKKLPVDILPDSVLMFDDTTVPYTVSVTGGPAGVRYRWKYRGIATSDSSETTAPSFSRRMTEPGRTMMYASILEGSQKRPIGRDSSAVIYGNGWQFTNVALTSTVLPPGGIGSDKTDTVVFNALNTWTGELRQTPANNLLFLYRGPNNCRGVILEGFPNGPIDDKAPAPNAFRAVLGTSCTDADLGGTFTMGVPGQGTVVGTAFETLANPDVTTVPGGSINGTMTGTKFQGTFVWKVRFSTGIALYTYTFQANMLVPK